MILLTRTRSWWGLAATLPAHLLPRMTDLRAEWTTGSELETDRPPAGILVSTDYLSVHEHRKRQGHPV